ncbi:MAG: hypothetical protein QX203_14530 [Methylococcaceae bacterium]
MKTKKLKKGLAVLGLAAVSIVTVAPVSAGILFDSAGTDAIQNAQSDAKELGGAGIVLGAMIYGIRRIRSL